MQISLCLVVVERPGRGVGIGGGGLCLGVASVNETIFYQTTKSYASPNLKALAEDNMNIIKKLKTIL